METALGSETRLLAEPIHTVRNPHPKWTMIVTADNQKESSDVAKHRNVVMHVNFTGEERLNYVLNNIENFSGYYRDREEALAIRVVCHGPGLHLLRLDTSPVKARLLQIIDRHDELSLVACANTMERMANAEGKRPEIIQQANLVPAGLPEIIELQNEGWIYIKP